MESLTIALSLLRKNDFMASVDIKDAYLHVPVAKDERHYLAMHYKNAIYQWTVLPFGLTSSPRIFTEVMKSAIKVLRKEGVRISFYLDDILIIGSTKPAVESGSC